MFFALPADVPAQGASEGRRLALVIGNADYNLDGAIRPDSAPPAGQMNDLKNPINDAFDISEQLRQMSYDVTVVENADRKAILRALAGLREKARHDSTDKVVIFYAGHAIQFNGENYLIPTGAVLPQAADDLVSAVDLEAMILLQTVPLRDIMAVLKQPARGGVNVVILDACRRNPWERRIRGITRGEGERGLADLRQRLFRTLVAYSTEPGGIAKDGHGRNSPYSQALKARLNQGHLSVTDLFNLVGEDVLDATNNEQKPWNASSAAGMACLGVCSPMITANLSRTPPRPVGPVALPDSAIASSGADRFVWPVRGPVLLGYGPTTAGSRNDGVNIIAGAGEPVGAAAAGDVVYAGDQVPGFGNLVLIKHFDGWVTAYGHLDRVDVRMGATVAQGQAIGTVGTTGGVDRPQLHFEVRYAPTPQDRARPVDPKLVLPDLSG